MGSLPIRGDDEIAYHEQVKKRKRKPATGMTDKEFEEYLKQQEKLIASPEE